MKTMASRVRMCAIFIALILVGLGCANKSNLRVAYDAVYTAAVTYDTSLTILGDMYRAGKITEEQKENIIKYAHKYYDTVQVVKKALISYKQAKIAYSELQTDENKEKIEAAEIAVLESLKFVSSAEADLLKLLE